MISIRSVAKKVIPRQYQPAIKSHLRAVTAIVYRGIRHTCPICGGHFRSFLADGSCPSCGAYRRQRLLWLYLKNRTNFFQDRLDVLEVAPIYSMQKRFKSVKNINYTSIDLELPFVDHHMDLTDMQFEGNLFDVIFCYHVLEHIPDDLAAMKELHRVLQPTGWALIQAPIARDTTYEDPNVTTPEGRLATFGQEDHVRIYGRDYKDRLEQAGFKVEIDHYVKGLDVEKYGLDIAEGLHICRK